jgi:hypothetical protein
MAARHPLAEQCTAKAKGTGQRCNRRVIGGGVCVMHGETRAGRAKRMERVALLEELARAPHRHPGAVLLDAVHTCDVLVQQAKTELAERGVTRKTVRALVDATIRAAALARSALNAEAEDRAARFGEHQVRAIDGALTKFLRRLNLAGDADARAALAAALEDVAEGDPLLTSATVFHRQPDEIGKFVASVLGSVLGGLGLEGDAWVSAQIAAALRAVGRGEVPQTAAPPRSWWTALVKRGCAELGLPDPTMPPMVEILPPLRRALTDGRSS